MRGANTLLWIFRNQFFPTFTSYHKYKKLEKPDWKFISLTRIQLSEIIRILISTEKFLILTHTSLVLKTKPDTPQW